MPGKVIPCALCPDQAAAFYCVNDDAHLCAACDASVHAANPLLARHERRALNSITCQTAECASAACTPAAPSCATDGDVAVVPQFCGGEEAEVQAPSPRGFMAAPTTDTSAAPLTLYEDSFFSRNLTTSDLLDLDSDELELPGGPALPFSFNPMVDCVVPSFDANPFMPQQQSSYMQPAFVPTYQQQQPAFVPMMGNNNTVAAAAPKPKYSRPQHQRTPEEEAEEVARVARHRERQRKKRNFGRAVRYQSRRAYAEVRPRIKGRFVTPEEYAAYQAGVPYVAPAQPAGGDKAAGQAGAMAAYAAMDALDASYHEEDGVVPMPPSFVM